YQANKHKMNMDAPKWIVGEDYSAAPTCATCHMSATRNQDVTHDVGMRISWNNRPAISIRPEVSDAKMGLAGANVSWRERRKNMKDVCSNCHNKGYVDNFYIQYDSLIELYTEKFAKPGLKLYNMAKPLMKQVKFGNKLDFIWFEIWHHEGRRARHGASMMGPDYTHWHGTYEVAKHFYIKFIPELEKLIKAGMKKNPKAAKALQKELNKVLNTDDHKWFLGKMSQEEKKSRKKAAADFKARYK
ncbi:hydroxylamine oxidoreductase, partial [bacterium]|nr:hydroxylamine oxidoreductase [bacterium]